MRAFLVLLAVLVAAPATAQVMSRPTDPPLVTAVNESWYQLREPVQFAGELYYPAGAAVFFNGNTMVRTGHYNGVPLYADTTVEPFSIILVPVTRGLMQPYERPRRGDLAGTTGSRPPSFPVQIMPVAPSMPSAGIAPTAPPLSLGAIGVFTPGTVSAAASTSAATTSLVAPLPAATSVVETVLRPQGNEGIWIQYDNQRWVSAGASVPYSGEAFAHVGEHGAFPVFARRAVKEDVIYLSTTRADYVAPYRLRTPDAIPRN